MSSCCTLAMFGYFIVVLVVYMFCKGHRPSGSYLGIGQEVMTMRMTKDEDGKRFGRTLPLPI